MAMSLNRVELIGRSGRDAELRYLADGQAVAKFSLATDRPVRGGGSDTDWHQVVLWGKVAEIAGEFVTKGRLVFVAGRLSYRSWEGKDGQQHRAIEIVGADLILLDRRHDAEAVAVPSSGAGGDHADDNDRDEVPF